MRPDPFCDPGDGGQQPDSCPPPAGPQPSADAEPAKHINYAARYWPGRQGEYRSADFEDEYRTALRALARTGRALEINTSGWLPPDPALLSWWREEGGSMISFGSDAHDPVTLGREFGPRHSHGPSSRVRPWQRRDRTVGVPIGQGARR